MTAGQMPSRPKQARGRARFEALLAAAGALIAERGVDGFAFSEVAKRTGTAQGSLYQYFPSKEAPVTTLHAQLADEVVEVVAACRRALRETPEPRGLAQLVDLLVPALADFYAANPAYREIRHALPRSAAVETAETGADRRIAGLLEDMVTDAGIILPEGRRSLVLEALIETGDTLMFWAGTDAARRREARTLVAGHLHAVAADDEP